MASNSQAYATDEKTPIRQKEKPVARISFWWVLVGVILAVIIIALLIALIVMVVNQNQTNGTGAKPKPRVGAPGGQGGTPKGGNPNGGQKPTTPPAKACDVAERLNGNGKQLFEKKAETIELSLWGIVSRGNVVYGAIANAKRAVEFQYNRQKRFGKFPSNTRDIALANDNIYVSMVPPSKTIEKYDKYVTKVGQIDLPVTPTDMAINNDYITILHMHRGKFMVTTYTHNGTEVKNSECPDSNCQGIAYDGQGDLYIATDNKGVIVKDASGMSKTIDVKGPSKIAFDPSGNIIISSKMKKSIYVVGKDLKLKLTIDNFKDTPVEVTVTEDCKFVVAFGSYIKFYNL